jgi:hypothetical protein
MTRRLRGRHWLGEAFSRERRSWYTSVGRKDGPRGRDGQFLEIAVGDVLITPLRHSIELDAV